MITLSSFVKKFCLLSIRKTCRCVDGFCENIAFSPKQISKVFEKARIWLPVKIHAEQLSNLGGASLAANFGALSADHLEYLERLELRQW
ncbi:MAG: hypothetical protein CM1200mP30_17100 [Pseudomonadota bacterium]|nr:MAG: hypothetical protein CM1200mP30_17100 [Pseudomonadota bacterium]